MNVEDAERETYEKVWEIAEYSTESPGVLFLPAFLEMGSPSKEHPILDAGCGAGAGMNALHEQGFRNVYGADIVDVRKGYAADCDFWQTPLWNILPVADWVYCCDVLEHVPEEFTMLVIARLLEVSSRGVFLSICLEPDNFGALVGQALHKTVRPFTWWRDRLAILGKIIECRDLLANGLYLVEPRR